MANDEQINEDFIAGIFAEQFQNFVPHKASDGVKEVPSFKWRNFNILEIFEPRRGDFHSITDLDSGNYMTVSRITSDNGVVGYFDRPEDAAEYRKGCITIITVGGDTFVQLDDFIATDNVIVCVPK